MHSGTACIPDQYSSASYVIVATVIWGCQPDVSFCQCQRCACWRYVHNEGTLDFPVPADERLLKASSVIAVPVKAEVPCKNTDPVIMTKSARACCADARLNRTRPPLTSPAQSQVPAGYCLPEVSWSMPSSPCRRPWRRRRHRCWRQSP